ncbi:HNH endonuclease [Methanobrevibacter arboriphilus]
MLCETSKEDREFNREHIVPKQLGGSLTMKNLCKDCNSKIDDELDKKSS